MRYQPASANPTATGCQPGTRALGEAIQVVWPELSTLGRVYGCFNRRRVAGSTTWSLHAEGRALDVGVGPSELELGWALACDLVAHRQDLGVMRVMWDRHRWSIEHARDWRRLSTSAQQHTDHVHVEQFRHHAARATREAFGDYRRVLQRARAAGPEARE